MGFPISDAQADCGAPSLVCDADQNSVVVRDVSLLGGEENRAFEKRSPELHMNAMSRWLPRGDPRPGAFTLSLA